MIVKFYVSIVSNTLWHRHTAITPWGNKTQRTDLLGGREPPEHGNAKLCAST